MRHWAINGRFLTQRLTGVQRYALEILRGLDEVLAEQPPLASGLEVELLVPPHGQAPPLRAIRTRVVAPLAGHAWEQLVLPLHVRGGLLSLCNTGPISVRKQILCIHDVNTLAFPQSYSFPFRLLYRTLLPLLGRRVMQLVTVSRYSAGELVRHGIAAPGRIAVIPNGHEHALRWTPRHSAATRLAAGRKTVVVIGSTIPHKNTALVLGMADRLAAAGLRVAVVGACDPRVFSATSASHESSNVVALGRVTDAELGALLQNCLCLAFPSFVEGFGLPPLEAMALGCPVVVSDRASLPEICAGAALYAPPDSVDAWFDRFVRLSNDPALSESLATRGRARAATFRWGTSAERYLEVMAAIDGLFVTPSEGAQSEAIV